MTTTASAPPLSLPPCAAACVHLRVAQLLATASATIDCLSEHGSTASASHRTLLAARCAAALCAPPRLSVRRRRSPCAAAALRALPPLSVRCRRSLVLISLRRFQIGVQLGIPSVRVPRPLAMPRRGDGAQRSAGGVRQRPGVRITCAIERDGRSDGSVRQRPGGRTKCAIEPDERRAGARRVRGWGGGAAGPLLNRALNRAPCAACCPPGRRGWGCCRQNRAP